jgi:hypothetical protein
MRTAHKKMKNAMFKDVINAKNLDALLLAIEKHAEKLQAHGIAKNGELDALHLLLEAKAIKKKHLEKRDEAIWGLGYLSALYELKLTMMGIDPDAEEEVEA